MKAIDSLFAESQQANKAFCLIACSNEPHTPYTKGDASAYPEDQLTLPPSFVDTAETRESYSKYLAEITYFDQQCGEIMDLLEAHKLTENTLIMVVSEQGSGFPLPNGPALNWGSLPG